MNLALALTLITISPILWPVVNAVLIVRDVRACVRTASEANINPATGNHRQWHIPEEFTFWPVFWQLVQFKMVRGLEGRSFIWYSYKNWHVWEILK